jgi:hypothetical protein
LESEIKNIKITYEYSGSDAEAAGLGMMTEVNETVDIKVSGTRDAIALLKMNPQKITASLDLSNIKAVGDTKVPIKIDLGNNQGLKLISQSKDEIRIKFDRVIPGSIDVVAEFNGRVGDGLTYNTKVTNGVINVKGPAAIINSIQSAKVQVGSGDVLSSTKTYANCEYVFVDKKGNIVEKTFITFENNVSTVDVTVEILQEKEVPLRVAISNGGPENNYFCTVKTNPETIKIAGDPEVLKGITSITLQPTDASRIDLAQRKEAFQEVLPVVLPDGLINVGNVETVKVSVSFENVQTKPFRVQNLELRGENIHKIKIAETAIELKVRGHVDDINKLKAEDIKVFVNCETVGKISGTTYVPISVEFPKDYRVGIVGENIKIKVTT